MAKTFNIDPERVLRVTDNETLQPLLASGEVDRAKTDFLEITGNSAASGSAVIKVEAKNANETNVSIEIGGKAAGTFTITSTGGIVVTSGNLTLTSGNAVLTSGNLTLTAGNEVLTLGDFTMELSGIFGTVHLEKTLVAILLLL